MSHDYYGMPVGGGQQHQPVYQTPLPYPPGAYASPPTPAYPGRGKGSYYAPPRMHNTPPPSASRYSSGPYSGRGGGGRRGPTPSTPSSFVHVSVGSAVPSAYNSESDMEPSRFNRSPQYSVWNADPPVNLPQYYNGTAFSPFSGPLGAASDVTDSLDGAQLQMHSSMTLSSGRKHKSKQGIGSRASDAAAEGHSRPSPDNDPPSHPRTANNDVCGTPSTGPINNSSMIEPYQELTEFETDPHRLLQRQKQIIFGKVTEGYRNYAVNVPFFSRREENLMHPLTPRTEVKVSKRRWDTITQDWRRTLHSWDGRTSNTDWIETTDPDLLEDPTDPSIVITREHIRKYADRVAYCLDNLRDHVSAAFGARDGGEEEVLAVPTTATGVQMHHGPVNALQRLTDAQQSLQRRRPGSKPQSPPPATKGSNQQTPETTSLGVAPVAVATHTPRRNGFAVNPLDSATTGRARSPSIHDLSDGDGDESIHAVVTSPAKFKQGAPGPSMPKLTALTVVILNQETQQPMQGFGVSLPGNAESIWSQLSGLFDTSRAWFHMAHRNTNDERPAATATPLGRRTTATPGGSPARHFGLRRGFPSSEEVVPPPCHIHHGECCWIHTLDTADNVSQFLKELPFGLPSVFIYAEALRVSTTDTFWRNATPILIDDTDVQEITFLQRNNLTPDGISTLLDHSAALPTASLFDPSPSPHQVGPNGTRGSIQARLDLTTPVEASPTSSKAAAAGNRA